MIKSIAFQNFRALRDTAINFSPFTLILGANGSGKSTVFKALQTVGFATSVPQVALVPTLNYVEALSAGVDRKQEVAITITDETTQSKWAWRPDGRLGVHPQVGIAGHMLTLGKSLANLNVYAFSAKEIVQPVGIKPNISLNASGDNLTAVLDHLQGVHPDKFDELLKEFRRWLPEFEYILLVPGLNSKSLAFRTYQGKHVLPAGQVSQGTLLALALLTLAYLPDSPPVICLEEPDTGLHPRLLRDVRDALYRLAYPQKSEIEREPVQVIATTHSPYFLSLFRDHPEEVVIADKQGLETKFVRLSERPDFNEIIGSTDLGEAWFSGVLGGVPAK